MQERKGERREEKTKKRKLTAERGKIRENFHSREKNLFPSRERERERVEDGRICVHPLPLHEHSMRRIERVRGGAGRGDERARKTWQRELRAMISCVTEIFFVA